MDALELYSVFDRSQMRSLTFQLALYIIILLYYND
jgi:predicted membrane protein